MNNGRGQHSNGFIGTSDWRRRQKRDPADHSPSKWSTMARCFRENKLLFRFVFNAAGSTYTKAHKQNVSREYSKIDCVGPIWGHIYRPNFILYWNYNKRLKAITRVSHCVRTNAKMSTSFSRNICRRVLQVPVDPFANCVCIFPDDNSECQNKRPNICRNKYKPLLINGLRGCI